MSLGGLGDRPHGGGSHDCASAARLVCRDRTTNFDVDLNIPNEGSRCPEALRVLA